MSDYHLMIQPNGGKGRRMGIDTNDYIGTAFPWLPGAHRTGHADQVEILVLNDSIGAYGGPAKAGAE
jgi:hypothetical protein